MPLDSSRRPTPAQAAPPPAAARPEPLPVAARPAPDGMGVVYPFAYTPAEPNPDDSLAYADYDAEGNLVARGRLPVAEAYRYTPRPLPAEGLVWSPHTRPDLEPGRWPATEELGPDGEDDPPGKSGVTCIIWLGRPHVTPAEPCCFARLAGGTPCVAIPAFAPSPCPSRHPSPFGRARRGGGSMALPQKVAGRTTPAPPCGRRPQSTPRTAGTMRSTIARATW